MLRFILLQNKAGKTRLSKYYTKFTEDEMRKVETEVHRTVTLRDGINATELCNFVEWRNYKLVYRRYAGLFFTVCIDTVDNELAYLEMIHLFVEVRPSRRRSTGSVFRETCRDPPVRKSLPWQVLDRYFGNVCELDLVVPPPSPNPLTSPLSAACFALPQNPQPAGK